MSVRFGTRAGRTDRGSATAELAVALPALVVFLAAALGAVSAVTAKLECVDAAREAALGAARGADGVTAGARRAPPGASIRLTSDGDTVRATVTGTVCPWGGRLPAVTVVGEATAALEPGEQR
ncbi:MAG TPA: TadE family type IV pilus minor pilin [Micromonosporaceae bacterium]